MSPKFISPFNGAPSDDTLFKGLFLFDPMLFDKMQGISISRVMKDLGNESLLKQMQKIRKEKDPKQDNIKKLIAKMESELPPGSELGKNLFLNSVDEIFKKDKRGEFVCLADVPIYRISVYCYLDEGINLNKCQEFLLDIERRSAPAWTLYHKERFAEAAIAILQDDFFEPFLWDGVRQLLQDGPDKINLDLIRCSIAMEIYLAIMVFKEMTWVDKYAIENEACILDLWPTVGSPKNPFGKLFDWVKKAAGARTIQEFVDHPKLLDVNMDVPRIKRWSNGSHQPDNNLLNAISEGLWGDKNHPEYKIRVGFARQINFIGHWAQHIILQIRNMLPSELLFHAYPWPNFPHDHQSFASWGRARYPFWQQYARDY